MIRQHHPVQTNCALVLAAKISYSTRMSKTPKDVHTFEAQLVTIFTGTLFRKCSFASGHNVIVQHPATPQGGHIGHKAELDSADWPSYAEAFCPSGAHSAPALNPPLNSPRSLVACPVSASTPPSPREEVLFCAFVPPSPSRSAPGRLMARPVAPSQKNRAPTLTLSIGVAKKTRGGRSHRQVGTKHLERASLLAGLSCTSAPTTEHTPVFHLCSTVHQPSVELSAGRRWREREQGAHHCRHASSLGQPPPLRLTDSRRRRNQNQTAHATRSKLLPDRTLTTSPPKERSKGWNHRASVVGASETSSSRSSRRGCAGRATTRPTSPRRSDASTTRTRRRGEKRHHLWSRPSTSINTAMASPSRKKTSKRIDHRLVPSLTT